MNVRVLSCVVLCACGGTIANEPDAAKTDSGSDVFGIPTPAPVPGHPPPPPISGTATNNVYTFAIQRIYLGDSPRGSTVTSSSAWKFFGYDIDNKYSDAQSTDVCLRATGAPSSVQVDGNAGIDNTWGANLLPILQSAGSMPNPSQIETDLVTKGNFTLEIQVTGLSDDPKQSALGLSGQVFLGAYYNGMPAFDANTDWPVTSDSVVDGQTIASGAIMKLANAYVSDGTFVATAKTFAFPFFVQGSVPFVLHDAIVTFDHTSHADAARGTIAGVLDTNEFLTAFKLVAGRIAKALCGSAFDGIAQQVRQCVDILPGGTNKPGVPCSALSVGLGFEAKLIANPTKVVPIPTVPPDPCK